MGIREIESLQDKAREMTREYRNMLNIPMSFLTLLSPYEVCVYSYLLEKNGSTISSWLNNEKVNEEEGGQIDVVFFEFSLLEIAVNLCLTRPLVRRCLKTLHKFGLITWYETEEKTKSKKHACCVNLPMFFTFTDFTKILVEDNRKYGNFDFSKTLFSILKDEKIQKEILKKVPEKTLISIQKKIEEKEIIRTQCSNNQRKKNEKNDNYLNAVFKSRGGYLNAVFKSFERSVQINSVGRYLETSDNQDFLKIFFLVRYIYTILKEYDIEKIGAIPSESPCAKNHRARKSDIENFKYIFSPKGMEEILPKLIEQKNGEDTKMKNLLEKEKSPIQKKVDRIFSSWNKLPNTVKHDPTRETYKKISEYLENLLLGKPMLCSNTGKLKKEFRIFGEENNISKEFLRREWKVKEIISILRELMKTKTKSPNVSLLNLLWARDMREEEIKKYYSPFLQSGAANLQEGVKPYRELTQMFYDAFTKQRKYPFDSAVLILYSFATKNNLSFDDMKTATEFILQENTSFKPKVISVLQFIEKYDSVLNSMRRWEQDNKKKQSGISFSSGTILQDLKKLKGD